MSADALAAFLVEQPTAIGRLLTEHVDDGRGHCRTCTIGGQHGFLTWPCTIHVAASKAARARKMRTPPPALICPVVAVVVDELRRRTVRSARFASARSGSAAVRLLTRR